MSSQAPSPRTEVHRLPKRASYDRAQIESILDSSLFCHVGFISDGHPVVIPINFARLGGQIYLHGSPGSRMLRALATGIECCLTVTLLDGLVLARSAFHHSVDYRSVVLFGRARPVTDAQEKWAALEAVTNKLVAGRWDEARVPNEHELKATLVLALPIEEASAKLRTGPPIDDEEDLQIPVWAGVVPIAALPGTPIPDAQCLAGMKPPAADRFPCFPPR